MTVPASPTPPHPPKSPSTPRIPRIPGRRGAGSAPARPAGRFDTRLVAPMVLGSILNPINSSMIAVALVPIGVAFGAPPAQTAWLVSALYLATAVGQPVIGRLVDSYGPRLLYLTGTALVGVAGLLGALAPSLGVLIAARVLLGFGTSAAYPASMYLTRSEARRTGVRSPAGVLTALAVSGQTISVIGPTLGGLLIGLDGWRLVFTINVPLSAACLVLGALRIPRRADLEPPAEPSPAEPPTTEPTTTGSAKAQLPAAPRIDIPGMVLFAATLVALMLFLMEPHLSDLYLVGVAAAAAAAFTVRELRVPFPFIDLRVFGGNGPLLATYLRQLLAYLTSYAFLYGYTQWLEEGRGLSAGAAGLVLLPQSLTAVLVSAATGRNAAIRSKVLIGAASQLAACGTLLLVHSGSTVLLLIAVGVLMGIPQGLTSVANQSALYHQADPARIGSAAGLLRTFMYLGALAATVANAGFFKHGAHTAGLHGMALFMAAGAALLLITTALDRSLGRVGRPAPA